jgi:hypothetical protein
VPSVSQSALDRRLRLRVCREPQRAGGPGRIEPEFLPPPGFIAVKMQLAMMPPAERDCELVADPAAEGAVPRKAQMMDITWLTSADQTSLLGDEAYMLAIANAPRFGMRQYGLVDRR